MIAGSEEKGVVVSGADVHAVTGLPHAKRNQHRALPLQTERPHKQGKFYVTARSERCFLDVMGIFVAKFADNVPPLSPRIEGDTWISDGRWHETTRNDDSSFSLMDRRQNWHPNFCPKA
jgi:hypothetical protein